MNNDPTALLERVAEELYYDQHPEGRHRSEWPDAVYPDTAYEYRDLAAAVLPIIAAEVQAAKAEAWTDCVSEASACGWLHAPAALDMLDRNPHETGGRA